MIWPFAKPSRRNGTANRPPRRDGARRPLSPRALQSHLFWAKAALAWERLWPLLWPPAALIAAFLIVALFDLLPRLAGWLHTALLAGFVLGLAAALLRLWRKFDWPSHSAARRRLERLNGLPHRPLALLDDRLPEQLDDPGSRLLWQVYQTRTRGDLADLKNHWPESSWLKQNPWELRGLLALLLLVALVVAGPERGARLSQAVQPRFAAPDLSAPRGFDAWITPPAYTGLPPRYLGSLGKNVAREDPIPVPQNTRFLAQVQGGAALPQLNIDGQAQAFERETDQLFRLEMALTRGAQLQLTQDGQPLQSWRINLIPDSRPVIRYLSPPGRTGRGALQLHYRAEDDYGLRQLTLIVSRQNGADARLELPLSLPLAPNNKLVESRLYQDLGAHRWAGLPVTVTLRGEDELGQFGQSESLAIILPQRNFSHPLARALIALRRDLARTPNARMPVSLALEKLRKQPEGYGNDLVVALGLSVASQGLAQDRRATAVGEAQDLLWYLALHLEQGSVTLAEQNLRALQQELLDALANDAPQEEIDRLMQAVEAAMDRFLQALVEQARQQRRQDGADPTLSPDLPENAEILDRDDLRDLLDQARQLAQIGARDQARRMLEQLQQMLENLQARTQSGTTSQQTQDARALMQRMDQLRRDQQSLLDRTFQQRQQDKGLGRQRGNQPTQDGEQGRDGKQGRQSSNSGDASAQELLRRELGDIMRRFGNLTGQIPRQLSNAEQAMRAARDAFNQGSPEMALNPQMEAVDQLQQGLDVMLESLRQQIGKGSGNEGGARGDQPGQGDDPLGRGGGQQPNQNEKIVPTDVDLPKAKAILNELQRRRGEQQRPALELDYLDRLLDRF